MGSASTWSLDRITSLAEEAAVAFYASLQDLGVADAVLGVAREVTDSTLLTLHIDLVRSYPTHLLNVRVARFSSVAFTCLGGAVRAVLREAQHGSGSRALPF